MPHDKRTILFVDDEKNVLDGLRRMLRSMRKTWDMDFAVGGEQALKMLLVKRYDLIVSDMRMPGMSGAELLTHVRKRYPNIARLVLTGQADKDSILQSVGPIHQFMHKPCDEQTLKTTISRTLEAGDLLEAEDLKSIVTDLESLPSLPSNQQELIARFQMPEVSANVVGEAIGKDVAMTAKILQLVNSAFFGLRRHVSSPADAVKLLGLDTVRSLVTTMQVFSQVSQEEVKGFSQKALLNHSAAVAITAKKISLAEGRTQAEAENAYLAGLLHDVGKLVLATKKPEEYAQAISLCQTQNLTTEAAEKQAIGATHSEIGGYLLGLWAFETPLVNAVYYHHKPAQQNTDELTIATIIHAANAIVRMDADSNDLTQLKIDKPYLETIGAGQKIETWWQERPKAA